MNPTLILFPVLAMFTLTFGCMLALGLARFRAIRTSKVKISYYRSYNEGTQPERLHLLGRHVQNHFEVPPLFYVVVILLYATGSVSLLALVLAWLFVIIRALHSYIHLGSNNVSRRFFTFGASLACLLALWVCLTASLVKSMI